VKSTHWKMFFVKIQHLFWEKRQEKTRHDIEVRDRILYTDDNGEVESLLP